MEMDKIEEIVKLHNELEEDCRIKNALDEHNHGYLQLGNVHYDISNDMYNALKRLFDARIGDIRHKLREI